MESLYAIALREFSLLEIIKAASSAGISPLYFVLICIWSKISINATWLVTLPTIINLIGIIALIIIATKSAGEKAGLFSGLIASMSPLLIHASIRPRYESLFFLFGIISIYYGFRLLTEKTDYKVILIYILSSALGIYAFYYHFFILIFQNLYFLTIRKNPVKWILSQIAIFILFLPWLPSMFGQVEERLETTQSFMSSIAIFFSGKYYFNAVDIVSSYFAGMQFHLHDDFLINRLVFFGTLLFCLICISSAYVYSKKNNIKFFYYLFFLQASCVFMAIFSGIWKSLMVSPKFTTGFAGAWFILCGLGFSKFRFRHSNIFCLVLLLLISFFSVRNYYITMLEPDRITLPETVASLSSSIDKNKDQAILIYPPYYQLTIDYYSKSGIHTHGIPIDHDLIDNLWGQNYPDIEFTNMINKFSDRDNIILILPRNLSFPDKHNELILSQLEKMDFVLIDKFDFLSDLVPRIMGEVYFFSKN